MTIQPELTLCFLLHNEDVLLLHRRFPPNQGLWNGVGGHILPGETPREAVIREVAEETGFQITDPEFAGLLTWDGFEIPPGGIAIFTAQAPHREVTNNHEGELTWQNREFACSSPEVVDNIHIFLPRILAGEPPHHYHFSYRDGVRIRDQIMDLPEDFNPDQAYQPHEEMLEHTRGDFLLSTDKGRLQLDVIKELLSKQSYWAQGRSREEIEQTIRNSICLGIYHSGQQVAFARLVTDEVTFAWFCDVVVDKVFRGKDLGKWLVESACEVLDRLGVKDTLLATRDAHSLYERYGGFHTLSVPDKWMQRSYSGEE
ncbi:MAG: GNAT family N-acetyltransferase [Brevefilum sp.]